MWSFGGLLGGERALISWERGGLGRGGEGRWEVGGVGYMFSLRLLNGIDIVIVDIEGKRGIDIFN